MTATSIVLTSIFLITFDGCNSENSEPSLEILNSSCTGAQRNYFFSWEDYAVILVTMLVSCTIGMFYCVCGRKQVTSDDFLLGGSPSSSFTMAMSLTSGFITAIELLGNPAEMYNFGVQLWMTCISLFFVIPITSRLYLPVFMNLRLTSCYEYLQLRFNQSARTMAATLYILQTVLYTSIAVYAPALALSNVTGMNVYLAVILIYVICIFYSSQGGMKAVIMTDTFQGIILIGSLITILVLGNNLVGGMTRVLTDSLASDRFNFFNTGNPTDRHDLWSIVIGGVFYWSAMFCSSQASIQKYLTVKNLGEAKKALWVSCFGLTLVLTINYYTGMILYSAFKYCDPIIYGEVSSSDELLPFFVMKMFSYLKGIPGFFVAGIFTASLGTVAAALNSLSAVSIKDLLTGAFGLSIPADKEAVVAKCLSILFGVVSFGLVFLVEELGSVLQAALSFNGMIGGLTLGMFSLGLFFPWANSKGVISGALTALGVILYIGIGSQLSTNEGIFVSTRKETSTSECPCLNSTTVAIYPVEKSIEGFSLQKLSFLWYSAISFGLTVFVGILVSFITGSKTNPLIDLNLLSPPLQNIMKKWREKLKETVEFPIRSDMGKKANEIPPRFALGITNFAVDLSEEKQPDLPDTSAK